MTITTCTACSSNKHPSFVHTVVTGNQYREPPSSAIRFPIAADLVNFTKGSRDISEVTVPPSLIQERMTEMNDNGEFATYMTVSEHRRNT